MLARAQAAGGSVPRAGGTTPWGGYSGIFVDPEGHPWEVAHNPGWTLREDGTVSLADRPRLATRRWRRGRARSC